MMMWPVTSLLALIRSDRWRRREQQRFQLLVIEICGQGPAHAGGAGPAEIAAHRPLAQPQALGNPTLRQLACKPQSQNFADLAHRHSLGWHLVPPAVRQRSETTLG